MELIQRQLVDQRALDVVQKKYIQTVAFGAPQPGICALSMPMSTQG